MGNGHKVVIVEDDVDTAALIEHTLGRDPRIEVAAVVADARSAVDTIRAVQPVLVVLDHYLEGGVMGLESAPVIKAVAPDMKLIVFTTEDLGLEAYLEPEIDAYLQKDQLVRLLGLAQRLLGLSNSPGPADQKSEP